MERLFNWIFGHLNNSLNKGLELVLSK